MWLNVIGWTATAVFSSSYFFKKPSTLRGIQAGAASLWVLYGVAIHSAPVVVANLIVGIAADPIETQTADLVLATRSVAGSLTGSSIENEDNLLLAHRRGIRSMNEVMPLAEAPKAYERMLSGRARFRVVLDTSAE